jgi:hypothetical protein
MLIVTYEIDIQIVQCGINNLAREDWPDQTCEDGCWLISSCKIVLRELEYQRTFPARASITLATITLSIDLNLN